MNKNMNFLFNTTTIIEDRNFKQSLENFFRLGINSAVKENIQNSLDAKLVPNKPVKVIIRTGIISVDELPGFEEIEKRIQVLKGANQYTKETILHMKNAITEKKVKYITFEDQNTKGLTYIPNSDKCSYFAYAYQQGNHYSDKNDSETMRGGSHGIGKIASNAISKVHLMYFANCDKYGHKLLGGTCCLIEHEYNKKTYRDMGYLTKSIFEPYDNTMDLEIFKKDTRGLKIIIPFLKNECANVQEIIKCICSEYFYAIINDYLIVEVNDKIINKENLEDYIFDKEYFIQQYEDMKKNFTVLNYKAYITNEPILINLNLNKNYKFNCYFMYDERIKRGRVTYIRRMGMKIADTKINGYATKPFNAVIIPQNDEADDFLKSLEDQTHNELTIKSIRDDIMQKNASRVINNLEKEIKKIFDELYNEKYPSEGFIDTTDLLYTFDRTFKDNISKKAATVLINKKSGNQIVTKINFGRREKEEKSKRKESKKTLRKVEKGNRSGIGKEVLASRYYIYPENIYRVFIHGCEYFEFDLSENDELSDYKSCNIVIRIVDGEGKETKKYITLNEYFDKIIDENVNCSLKTYGNIIRNVSIENNKVKMKFYPSTFYNSTLKYIYFVEV